VAERLIKRVEYPLLQCSCVGRASIAGQVAVQFDANATRRHFGDAAHA
jgi:hypothetical protein